MSKQLHWKKLAAPSILQIIYTKKKNTHIQCKVKKLILQHCRQTNAKNKIKRKNKIKELEL